MRRLIEAQDSLITGPTIEPLDLEEVKKALKFTPTTEDTLIDVWISAARMYFEEQTGRQLLTATWERWLDACPDSGIIELPHPPLQSVVSVAYDDSANVEHTFDAASYVVSAPQGPTCERGRVSLVSGGSWPSTVNQARSVRIRYIAGYGDAPGDVPELIKGALYFLVGHFHRFRSEGVEQAVSKLPLGAETIMRAFRLSAIAQIGPSRSEWVTETTIP